VIFKKIALVALYPMKLPSNYFLINIPATDFYNRENQTHLRVSSPFFRHLIAGIFFEYSGIKIIQRDKLEEKPPCFFKKEAAEIVSGFFDVLG
jgi:hypothetical protein